MNVDSNNRVTDQFSNEEEEEEKAVAKVSKFHGWHSNGNNDNSSRIYRVSRATGGKDRHSKVLTSKGLRDRRVRLSVSTAIAFYDLQDRLGYDQPSKAVEWLIKASEEAIAELPELNTTFSAESTSFLLNSQKKLPGVDTDRGDLNNPSSGLSLSRPEEIRVNRVKARERARETRVAKEREKENENEMRIGDLPPSNQTLASLHNASFTDLLTSGLLYLLHRITAPTCTFENWKKMQNENFQEVVSKKNRKKMKAREKENLMLQKQERQKRTTRKPARLLFSPFSAAAATSGDNHNPHGQHHHSSSSELQHQQQQQQYTTNDMQHYDLNFRMSPPSSDCFNNNRGTLQSNLSVPSLFPPHQYTRFSSEDGPNNNNNNNNDNDNNNMIPFFFGGAPSSSISSETNNNSGHHHHHLQQDHYGRFDAGFDGQLQLFHGDGTPHSDQKGKRKN